MEFLRFIKWQWNRFDYESRALFLSLVTTVTSIIYCTVMSLGFFAGLAWALGAFFGTMSVAWVLFVIQTQWIKYVKHRDFEAEEIVRKLAGNPHRNGVGTNR